MDSRRPRCRRCWLILSPPLPRWGAWLNALRDYLQENLRFVADTLNRAFPALRWQPPEANLPA